MAAIVFLLMLIPALSFGDCSTAQVYNQIRPGTAWVILGNGSAKEAVKWTDKVQTKPTAIEFNAGLAACNAAQNLKAAWKVELSTTTQSLAADDLGYDKLADKEKLAVARKVLRIMVLKNLLGIQ